MTFNPDHHFQLPSKPARASATVIQPLLKSNKPAALRRNVIVTILNQTDTIKTNAGI